MSDIFKEVDDALKQEKVNEFWAQYGNLVILMVILIIAGTGAYSAYNFWKTSHNEKNTSIILAVSKSPEEVGAAELNQLDSAQRAIADLFLAQKHLEKDEFQKAFNAFESVRNNKAAEINLRGIAAYYARNMIINQQVDLELSDVTLEQKSIWDNHFKLQEALHLGSQKSNLEDAIALLDEIINSSNQANQTVIQQAQQLKYVYEYDQDKGK